jgi:hypothetical protein
MRPHSGVDTVGYRGAAIVVAFLGYTHIPVALAVLG